MILLLVVSCMDEEKGVRKKRFWPIPEDIYEELVSLINIGKVFKSTYIYTSEERMKHDLTKDNVLVIAVNMAQLWEGLPLD